MTRELQLIEFLKQVGEASKDEILLELWGGKDKGLGAVVKRARDLHKANIILRYTAGRKTFYSIGETPRLIPVTKPLSYEPPKQSDRVDIIIGWARHTGIKVVHFKCEKCNFAYGWQFTGRGLLYDHGCRCTAIRTEEVFVSSLRSYWNSHPEALDNYENMLIELGWISDTNAIVASNS